MSRLYVTDMEEFKKIYGKDWNEFSPYIETKKEQELTKLFWKLGIQSSVKTDKKSLPYQHIITTHESVGDLENTSQLYRKLIKHLLEEDAYKIRFFIETELGYGCSLGTLTLPSYITGITYHIKYYIHKR